MHDQRLPEFSRPSSVPRLYILLAHSNHLLLVVTSFFFVESTRKAEVIFKAVHLARRPDFPTAQKICQICSAVVKEGLILMLIFVVALKDRAHQIGMLQSYCVF